jgi:hypothetical protein
MLYLKNNTTYPKLAKTICLSYYPLSFLFKKSEKMRVEQVLPGSWGLCGVRDWEESGTNNVYTCK